LSSAPSQRTAAICVRRSAVASDNTEADAFSRSLAAQERECLAWAEHQGLTVTEVYRDKAGTSASHIKNHDRPQYDRALADMGSAYEVILSWRSNRLVRVGMRMLLLDFQEDALSGALLDQPVVRFLSGGQPWVHCASWGSR